jgi:hypothetical protein
MNNQNKKQHFKKTVNIDPYIPIWKKKIIKKSYHNDPIETIIFTYLRPNNIKLFVEYLNNITKKYSNITLKLLEHHSLEIKNIYTGKKLLIVYNALIWILNSSIYKVYGIQSSNHLELNIEYCLIYINKFIDK